MSVYRTFLLHSLLLSIIILKENKEGEKTYEEKNVYPTSCLSASVTTNKLWW